MSEFIYILFYILAVVGLASMIVFGIKQSTTKKNKNQKTKFEIQKSLPYVMMGVALGIFFLLFPCCLNASKEWLETNGTINCVFNAILSSIHYTIRVFVVDTAFEEMTAGLIGSNVVFPAFVNIYTWTFSVLYVVAPLLTFGAIMIALNYLLHKLRYDISLKKKIYIFSYLNEQSVLLAESICEKEGRKALIVFADVDKEGEEYNEYKTELQELNAVIFKEKVDDIKIKKNEKVETYIFLINDVDEKRDDEILTTLIKINEMYYTYGNLKVYAFTRKASSSLMVTTLSKQKLSFAKYDSDIESSLNALGLSKDSIFVETTEKMIANLRSANENFTSNKPENKITEDEYNSIFNNTSKVLEALVLPRIEIHLVDYQKNMLYELLNEIPNDLLCSDEEKIDTVIVGLGDYGKLMLKTLCWYCQVPNKEIVIHGFDKRENIEDLVKVECPELFNKDYTKQSEGNPCFDVTVSTADVLGYSFEETLSKDLPNAKLILVSLGDDEQNIEVATRLRKLYKQLYLKKKTAKEPMIVSVVYNSEIVNAIKDAGVRSDRYDIKYIGSSEQIYNVTTILQSKYVESGFKGHMMWSANPYEDINYVANFAVNAYPKCKDIAEQIIRNTFYENEYNYNSSIASAFYYEIAKKIGLFGLNKSEQTQEERDAQKVNEHRRWTAYMLSIGFIPTAHYDRSERNDMAKMHHDIRDFCELSAGAKMKDQVVNQAHIEHDKTKK